ncbi:hypothetical protein N9934_01805 [Desulfosarcina sp.]|nr:hypothetical protein [Desulfosarcina sp.]
MRYIILLLVALTILSGCGIKAPSAIDIPIGDDCTLTCQSEGYESGSCMRTGIVEDPCETKHNLITPPKSVVQCPQGEYSNIDGLANYCCCEFVE